MIVADTNLISYLLIPGPRTAEAERVMEKDPMWFAPPLWRSEFLNVLWRYLRTGALSYADATRLFREAKRLLLHREHAAEADQVLALAAASGCTAYDCEFVALAQHTGAPLVTPDRKVLAAFPATAVSPQEFAP